MKLSLRKFSFCGRFPLIRLQQVLDNPSYILHIIKKNIFYKHDKIDYSSKYKKFKFLSGQETLESLISSGKSLARFSDGEFEMLTGAGIYPPDSDWSQRWSKGLVKDLETVLSSADDRLLVAVDPPSTFLAAPDSVHPIRFEYNMWIDMRRTMWKYLSPQMNYGHSHLFLQQNCPDVNWALLKSYMSNYDIIVATGNIQSLRHLRLGRNTFFVECGKDNAYERIDSIKQSIRDKISAEKLDKCSTIVFASLGASAGIIAYQLLFENIRVWDTGHMFEFAAKDFIENVLANNSV
jgi:hypothetical protein